MIDKMVLLPKEFSGMLIQHDGHIARLMYNGKELSRSVMDGKELTFNVPWESTTVSLTFDTKDVLNNMVI